MEKYEPAQGDAAISAESSLSYKFQRLRERLRQAIASGELSGKLPGERQLSRRFEVNAKTLSKALTDLAAEGLLERSVGRGTFVRDGQSPAKAPDEKWLMICDADQVHAPVAQAISQENPMAQIATDISSMRPSFINQFKAVVNFSEGTPDSFLRDLIVRNIALVSVGREPRTYSSHAVLVDRTLGTHLLARDMMLAGHSKFFSIEDFGQSCIAQAIRLAAGRYNAQAVMDGGGPDDASIALQHGATAFICGSRRLAIKARESLERSGASIPADVSLGAVGCGWGEYPCSGYFVHAPEKAKTVITLLRETNAHRPVTLWLAGHFIDGGTLGPCRANSAMPLATVLTHRVLSVPA